MEILCKYEYFQFLSFVYISALVCFVFTQERYGKAKDDCLKGMAFLYFYVIDRERLILLSSEPLTARDVRGCLHRGRKILEGGTTLLWGFMQKYWSVKCPSREEKNKKLQIKTKLQFGPSCVSYHNNKLVVAPDEMVGPYCRESEAH